MTAEPAPALFGRRTGGGLDMQDEECGRSPFGRPFRFGRARLLGGIRPSARHCRNRTSASLV